MTILWTQMKGFNRYSVSETGLIRHDEHDRVLTQFRNYLGFVYVCLYRDGRNLKRGVAKIVADHYLDPDPMESFDTPINLDGDRGNNEVYNLMWRPRWFALLYHKQFEEELISDRSVMEVNTGAYFADALVAASCYGLLTNKLITSTIRKEPVWPTQNKFRFVS